MLLGTLHSFVLVLYNAQVAVRERGMAPDYHHRKHNLLPCSCPAQQDGGGGPRPTEEQQLEAFQTRVSHTVVGWWCGRQNSRRANGGKAAPFERCYAVGSLLA